AKLAGLGIKATDPLIIINPNTSPDLVPEARKWPKERYAALADELVAQVPNARACFIGAPAERPYVESVAELCKTPRHHVLAGVHGADGSGAARSARAARRAPGAERSRPMSLIRDALVEGARVRAELLADHEPAIAACCTLVRDAVLGGKKILLCGNGGSAADAQHIAAELVGRFVLERRP